MTSDKQHEFRWPTIYSQHGPCSVKLRDMQKKITVYTPETVFYLIFRLNIVLSLFFIVYFMMLWASRLYNVNIKLIVLCNNIFFIVNTLTLSELYTVWQLSSRTEAIKNHTKKIKIFINTITRYSSHPLLHNVYIAHTTNRMPEKMLLPVSSSILLSQSGGSMKQPWISSLWSQFLI
jgi:hypothetical protein